MTVARKTIPECTVEAFAMTPNHIMQWFLLKKREDDILPYEGKTNRRAFSRLPPGWEQGASGYESNGLPCMRYSPLFFSRGRSVLFALRFLLQSRCDSSLPEGAIQIAVGGRISSPTRAEQTDGHFPASLREGGGPRSGGRSPRARKQRRDHCRGRIWNPPLRRTAGGASPSPTVI